MIAEPLVTHADTVRMMRCVRSTDTVLPIRGNVTAVIFWQRKHYRLWVFVQYETESGKKGSDLVQTGRFNTAADAMSYARGRMWTRHPEVNEEGE